MKLEREFYIRNTLIVAKDLIGKILVTNKDGKICKGIIVETEAYLGKNDKACHSYKDKGRNGRTNILYGEGGYSYVYLIYGMHCCFNVVASGENIPEGILIRAVEPIAGLDIMCERRGIVCDSGECEFPYKTKYALCSGPGKLCAAFDITRNDYGVNLCGDVIWIENGSITPKINIAETRRINIQYAGDDSFLPYRFIDRESRFLSKFNI